MDENVNDKYSQHIENHSIDLQRKSVKWFVYDENFGR